MGVHLKLTCDTHPRSPPPAHTDRRTRLLNRPDEIDAEIARYPGPGRWVGVRASFGGRLLPQSR